MQLLSNYEPQNGKQIKQLLGLGTIKLSVKCSVTLLFYREIPSFKIFFIILIKKFKQINTFCELICRLGKRRKELILF